MLTAPYLWVTLQYLAPNNGEEKKPKTLCHEWGRNSNKFNDRNDQKPYL